MNIEKDLIDIAMSLNEMNKELKEKNLELYKENERLNNIIDRAIEYIENNSLYEQDYDYDYEENLVEGVPDDTVPKRILLEILKDSDKE